MDSSTTKITDLFICCDGGDSRSPAIAAAILRLLGMEKGWTDEWKQLYLNTRKVAFEIHVTEDH